MKLKVNNRTITIEAEELTDEQFQALLEDIQFLKNQYQKLRKIFIAENHNKIG